MILKLRSENPSKTREISGFFGKTLKGDEVILIAGELGAGKTLFTKGIAEGLGIDEDEVVSPTFTIMNKYSGTKVLYHFDLYRLGNQKGFILPELDEVIDEGTVVVEWSQYADNSYKELTKAINIDIIIDEGNFNYREIVIETELDYIIDAFSKG